MTTQPLTRPARTNAGPILTVDSVDFRYGAVQALHGVTLEVYPNEVLALMGPSGCGKTTLLRCLNRMTDVVRDGQMTGTIRLEGADIRAPEVDPPVLRRRFGWVAQVPNPFPRSVYENVAYPARLHGLVEPGRAMDAHVRACLERVGLWGEVADRLDAHAPTLSGGQQQRLCIARALSQQPSILLMDEPTSSLDPTATARIEALIRELRETLSIVIITHNREQARRIADRVAFLHSGRRLEVGPADLVFPDPLHPLTAAYLAGRSG